MRFALAIALALSAAAWGQPADPRQEVEGLLQTAKFTAAETGALQNGTVVARAETGDAGEILTQAAVKIRVPHAQVVSYYGQMIAYVDGKVTLGFGQFSTPAAPADVEKLSFDRGEVDALKNCRPGKCDVRVGGAALATLQSSI